MEYKKCCSNCWTNYESSAGKSCKNSGCICHISESPQWEKSEEWIGFWKLIATDIDREVADELEKYIRQTLATQALQIEKDLLEKKRNIQYFNDAKIWDDAHAVSIEDITTYFNNKR